MASEVRVPLVVLDPATEGAPDVRAPLVVLDPATEGAPDVLAVLALLEPATEGSPVVRVPIFMLEAVIDIPEEGELATDLLPTNLGISWTTHKIPNYNTQVRTPPSLRSIRNSMTQYPAWDFELTFPWLPSDSPFASITDVPDLQVILGFFKKMRGMARDFLFRDPQDYRVRGYLQATGDGVTTEFDFIASVMGDDEPIGQVDLLERFSFAPGDVSAAADTIAHAAHGLATGDGPFFVASTVTIPPGLAATTPYWAIVVDVNTIKLAASSAGALAGTAVNITGAGAGVHSLTGGWAVYDAGALQTAGVTFNVPNGFTFDVAPVDTHAITADFDYLFVCHFLKDAADAEQIAGDLFELQQLQFRADPP